MKVSTQLEIMPDGDLVFDVTNQNLIQVTESQITIRPDSFRKIEVLQDRYRRLETGALHVHVARLPFGFRKYNGRFLGSIVQRYRGRSKRLRFFAVTLKDERWLVCEQPGYDIDYILLNPDFFERVIATTKVL
jgi:hypothetical protein